VPSEGGRSGQLTVCTDVHILGGYVDDAEWDPRKAAANLKKHGVDFADAATVLHDDSAITIRVDEADEERYVTIGMDAVARLLVVVYTWRGSRPRLISARTATPHERQEYEAKP
jgi:uncharacterized protein